MNPAPRGTGITGPPLARKLLEYAGVQDAYVIIRGEEPELATLCEAILSAVKDTFTIFQDKILQAYKWEWSKCIPTSTADFNVHKLTGRGSALTFSLFYIDVVAFSVFFSRSAFVEKKIL